MSRIFGCAVIALMVFGLACGGGPPAEEEPAATEAESASEPIEVEDFEDPQAIAFEEEEAEPAAESSVGDPPPDPEQ